MRSQSFLFIVVFSKKIKVILHETKLRVFVIGKEKWNLIIISWKFDKVLSLKPYN